MNSFLEIFERFKSDEASREESALVREEIGKFEAIEEYLAERFEQMAQTAPIPGETDPASGRSVARKIRGRIIGGVVIVLLALALLAVFAVTAIDSYYYDPNEGIEPVYSGDGQFAIDMWALTELHSAGYTLYGAEALRTAPGCYDIRFRQGKLFSGEQSNCTARVVRGKNISPDSLSFPGYLNLPVANAFGYREGSMVRVDETGKEHRSPAKEYLRYELDAMKELPRSSRAAVYVTFAKDKPIKEFAEHYGKWSGELDFYYAAVVSDHGYISNTVGFSPDSGGIVLENTPEGYPDFQLSGNKSDTALVWERHFRSLLGYLSGRPQFLRAVANTNGIGAERYGEIIEYIDENGVNIYGALVSGKAESVLNYLETEGYLDFYVDDVRLSVLGRG